MEPPTTETMPPLLIVMLEPAAKAPVLSVNVPPTVLGKEEGIVTPAALFIVTLVGGLVVGHSVAVAVCATPALYSRVPPLYVGAELIVPADCNERVPAI